jgi:hypothetical protein
MKRNLIFIFIVVLIAVAASFIFFSKNEGVFSKETSLYKAVPVTAPVFVELSSINAIPKANPILEELIQIEDFAWLLLKFKETETSIKQNAEIQNKLAKKPVIIALDFIGENVLKPLIISEVKSSEELGGFEKLLEHMLGVSSASFKSRKYDGHKIVDIVNKDGKPILHYCAVAGLIIISPEPILVEKGIRQLNSQNITDIKYFSKVNKTVNAQSDISWYINHERFPELWANFLDGTTKSGVNEFGETVKSSMKKAVQGIRNYASWSELDMTFEDNRISLNGITAADDSLNNFLSVFEGQEAISCEAGKVLPKNTSFFIGFAFSDRELFFKNLEQYFVHSNTYFEREGYLKKIQEQFKVDARNALRSLVRNQVIAAVTNVAGESEDKTSLFILNNDSRTDTKAVFEKLLKSFAQNKKVEFSSLVSEYKDSNGSTFQIYDFPYPSLPGIWLGKSFNFVEARYAALWEDNLVFASSKGALQKYISDMENEMSLSKSSDYNEFKREAESKANINVYVDVNRIYGMNTYLFNSDVKKSLDKNEDLFRKFDALGWQVVCEKDIFFNSLNLRYNSKPKTDARALWQNNIGATIRTKPQIVINHKNKASNEIIFQDENNKLNLISAEGKVVWSIPVNGKILSEIHQVDYYRNGRLQYLFNTSEKLYLIDRDGNAVAKFPKVFSSSATNGVSVFDYDNNLKYRYFVACENKKVYAYDHEGNIISGWKFGQTNSVVTDPVQHFRVNNKDYIVFKDNAKIYMQNRQGETRVESAANFDISKNPLVLNTNGTPKIVASDKTGKVFYLYFNGKYEEKKTDRFSKNHFFTVSDIDGNGVPDFIFVDSNELTVMDEKGNKLFSKKFDNELSSGANIYSFSSTRKEIGISDVEDSQIYLFDSRGKLHEGFPLQGNSQFAIGKLSGTQLNLVVGSSEGGLYNYLLE